MKRLLLSAGLLAAIIGIGIWTLHTQNEIVDSWLEYTEQINMAYKKNDLSMCKDWTIRFRDSVNEHSATLSSFLPHKPITEIEEAATALVGILEQPNHNQFLSELARCRYLLNHLKKSELPSFENIL